MKQSFIHRHLKEAAEHLKSGEPICFVFGNEAADLDSMATSVLYSAYKAASNPGQAYVPVIPVPRADFPLRTEALWLFSQAGVDSKDLLFAEDADLTKLLKRSEHACIMIDHNRPSQALGDITAELKEIVDHHEDEQLFPNAESTIVPVGSCATLAAEKIFSTHEQIIDESAALLLAGTILLDTVNLDPEAKRVTPRDAEVVEKLKPLLSMDTQKLFDSLQFEKFNVSALSSYDILRKDYKEYQWGDIRCGISSSLLSISAWKTKDPNLSQSLQKFSAENSLDILISMCAYTDPEFTRELIIFTEDSYLLERSYACLDAAETQLSPISKDGLKGNLSSFALYAQGDVSKSRKKIAPILQECFS